MNWTERHLKKLLKEGKIRGYIIQNNANKELARLVGKDEPEQIKTIRSYLQEIHELLKYNLEEEFSFHPERKWRFDFAFPELKIAVEYEGLQSEKSRHTTITGYTGDTEKYNEAQRLGWQVLRYTALNYESVAIDVRNLVRARIMTN